MIELARQKWISKKKRKKTFKSIKKRHTTVKKNINFKKIFFVFWIIIWLILFFYWIFFVLKSTILQEKYYIHKVKVDIESIKKYDDSYLYDKIRKKIIWKNYYVIKYKHKKNIEKNIKKNYPIVKNIDFFMSTGNTLLTTVNFYDIDLIIKTKKNKFWLFWDFWFKIYTWNTIGSWCFQVDLPIYVWNINWLTGLFIETPANNFIEYTNQIKNLFSDELKRLIYFPWAKRFLVETTDKKNIFFNTEKNINNQFKNLHNLKKFYEKYNKIHEIDLWSLNDNKIIVWF